MAGCITARITFVGVEQGISLEALDREGTGPPLVRLAGLGGIVTAHCDCSWASWMSPLVAQSS